MHERKLAGFQITDHTGTNIMGDGTDPTDLTTYPSFSLIPPTMAAHAATKLKAGQFSMHHERLIHGSDPNDSDDRRLWS